MRSNQMKLIEVVVVLMILSVTGILIYGFVRDPTPYEQCVYECRKIED
jgi:hypothetical protein